MSNEEMDKAHCRDYRTKNSLRDLRITLTNHPVMDSTEDQRPMWPRTYQEIQRVIALLKEQEDSIVWSWD
jgi:hypothetical protein